MNELPVEKVECPSCGQHYSVQITAEEQEITCQACQAVFTVARGHEPEPGSSPQTTTSKRSLYEASQSASIPSPRSQKLTNRISLLDRFMGLLFRFGKTFAGLLAILCLLSVFLSLGIFTWNLRTSFGVPEYSDIANSKTDDNSSPDTSGLDEKRAIEKNYGDRVSAIIKEYKFAQDDYYTILSMVKSMREENRSRFLGGLEKVLDSRVKATAKDSKNSPSVQEIAGRYAYAFSNAESRYESKKASSAKSMGETET